jgi:hypothetical protein
VPWHWVKDGAQLVPSWKRPRAAAAPTSRSTVPCTEKDRAQQTPFLLAAHRLRSVVAAAQRAALRRSRVRQVRATPSRSCSSPGAWRCVGRAKVFYDEPREFAEVLGKGGTIGDAWQRYFELESDRRRTGDEVGDDIGRKRAYFWSLVGDWTLRLPRAS